MRSATSTTGTLNDGPQRKITRLKKSPCNTRKLPKISIQRVRMAGWRPKTINRGPIAGGGKYRHNLHQTDFIHRLTRLLNPGCRDVSGMCIVRYAQCIPLPVRTHMWCLHHSTPISPSVHCCKCIRFVIYSGISM